MPTRPFRARHWLRCLLLLSLAALCAQASAADKRMALVIGNATYQGEKPLRNPGNDAQDIATALQRAGMVVQRHTNLGRTEMNRAIESFMQASEGAELAVVYYSGHGMQASGEAFLIPVDAKIQSERDVRSEGVRLGELMDDLEARRIRNTLLIIDACRDNPYRTRTKSATKGLARPKEMNGAFLVAYATADGTTADDGDGRNGKYTEQLLKQLSVPGKSLRDVVEDTQLAVEKSTAGAQRPKNYGDTAKFRSLSLQGALGVGGQVSSLERGNRVNADQNSPEDEAWQAAKIANTVVAFKAYLSEYPKGKYVSAARIATVGGQPSVGQSIDASKPVVNDQEVRAEYEKFLAANSGKEYKSRHILLAKEDEALVLIGKINGGANFEDLARRFSRDPGSGPKGGALEWASPKDYVKEFGDVLNSLAKGQMTQSPVKTVFGYHIVQVDDVRDIQVPKFEDVRAQIVKTLEQRRDANQ